MGDSRTISKLGLTISNISIEPCQTDGSLIVVFPIWRRKSWFLSGDLDFTLLNQERNSIPNEFLKLEALP